MTIVPSASASDESSALMNSEPAVMAPDTTCPVTVSQSDNLPHSDTARTRTS